MRLRAGHGYWATDHYPIGGDFKRASKTAGKDVACILRAIKPPYRGCNMEVEFTDGTRGAINSGNCDTF